MSENANQERLSLLSELIKMARADNEIREVEFNFLLAIASQLGVTKNEFKQLFEQYIEFAPPKVEFDRILQFHRLVLLMNVDQQIDEKELDYIRNVGIRMGLHPNATAEVLRIMEDYENNIVPPNRLIEIFKTFHN